MRLNELFEASEWRDRAIRAEAERAFSEIYNEIESQRLFPFKVDERGTYFYIDNITGFPSILGLMNDRGRGGAMGNASKQGEITFIVIEGFANINLDDINFMNERDRRKVLTALFHKKDIFVHEYIHAIDSKRTKGFFDRSSVSSSELDYYNHPNELNAYYQEAIQKFTDEIRFSIKIDEIRSREDFNSIFGDNQDEVFDFFKRNFLDRGYWNNLTDDNKRRIRKRFYNFYTETMPELIGEY